LGESFIPASALVSQSPAPIETQGTDAPSLAWYVVHTKPRQEDKALLNLERQGYRCYLPRLTIEKIRRGKVTPVTEAMFPRYLFIELDSSQKGKSWTPIRSTLGVHQLVNFGRQPARVDARLIDALRSREEARPPEVLFQPGERVTVVSGPLAGLEAIYQMTDGEQRSLLLLELLNQTVHMPVDTALLRKVD
jgi:transcriptional antiterminator RfaH